MAKVPALYALRLPCHRPARRGSKESGAPMLSSAGDDDIMMRLSELAESICDLRSTPGV